MIRDEICTYEVCKLAKEKGFRETVGWYYNTNGLKLLKRGCNGGNPNLINGLYSAPTQSLLQRWLREEKGVVVEVMCLPTTRTSSKYEYKRHIFWGSDGHYIEGKYGDEIFDTYELALEDALKYALEKLV